MFEKKNTNNDKIRDLECIEFKFDQASSFLNSNFYNSAFEKSKLKFDATDVEFYNCLIEKTY